MLKVLEIEGACNVMYCNSLSYKSNRMIKFGRLPKIEVAISCANCFSL